MFLTRFLISNIFSVFLIGLIVLLKKILNDKVSLRFHYHIWYVLLLSLMIGFLPTSFFQAVGFSEVTQNITSPANNVTGNEIVAPDMPNDWRYDFTEMADTSAKIGVNAVVGIIWLIGVLGIIIVYTASNKKIKKIQRYSEVPPTEIKELFDNCCQLVSIKHRVYLFTSDAVTSPLSFGCRTSYILIPSGLLSKSKEMELEHIFLHELMHIKHKDILFNFWFCIEQVIYWVNPFIWWAFSKMRTDREAYCDWSVLNGYDTDEERLCYGDTLLQFASQRNNTMFYTANSLFENKGQLKYRIEKIANFKRETTKTKLLSICLSTVLVLAALLQTPVFAAFASDFGLKYTPNRAINIIEQDYANLYNDASGCAVIFDMKSNTYQVYNQAAITKRIAPCSTCKIYSAINALEQGVITPENNSIEWDYLSRNVPAWDGNQNLNSALRNSVNWYFQLLDKTVGADELEQFYKSIGYGNGYVGNDTAYYWNGSNLKISPLEQVELLTKFYNNEFEFAEENISAVKNAILLSDKNNIRVYGKTGTGRIGNNDVNGWFVGYIETMDNVYVFAVNIQDERNANGNSAVQITQSIFETMGIKIEL